MTRGIGREMPGNEVRVALTVTVDRETFEARTLVDIYNENRNLEDSQVRAVAIAGLVQGLEAVATESPETVRVQVTHLCKRLGLVFGG